MLPKVLRLQSSSLVFSYINTTSPSILVSGTQTRTRQSRAIEGDRRTARTGSDQLGRWEGIWNDQDNRKIRKQSGHQPTWFIFSPYTSVLLPSILDTTATVASLRRYDQSWRITDLSPFLLGQLAMSFCLVTSTKLGIGLTVSCFTSSTPQSVKDKKKPSRFCQLLMCYVNAAARDKK